MGFFRKKVITFFMNENCNLRCIYCTIHSKAKENMDKSRVINLDFAKCGIDDYFSNGFFKPGEKKGIRIFGNGEPTISFERMKSIVEYANEKSNHDLFVEMQTNGYFSEEIAYWLRDNVDLLYFSLDGLDEVQRIQRPTIDGSPNFQVIDRNIKIINKSKRTKIGFRPTISKYNVDRQKELIDYAKENNVVAVCPNPWSNYVGQVEGQPDFIYYADKFLEAWEYAKGLNITYQSLFTVNFDEEVEVFCRSCLATPSFTTDGYVSSCDEVNTKDGFLPTIYPELLFGEWNSNDKKIIYYEDRINKIKSRNIHNLQHCQNCEVLKHCAGGCIGQGMFTGNFYGVNKKYCAVTKYLFKKMSQYVNSGYNENNPIHP